MRWIEVPSVISFFSPIALGTDGSPAGPAVNPSMGARIARPCAQRSSRAAIRSKG